MMSVPPRFGPLRVGLLAASTALALSPVLVDLAAHQLAMPSSRYALLFLPLFVWCARQEPGPDPRRDGYAWIALGLALELLALAAGMPRNGRPGIALATLGLCRVTGLTSVRCALLSAWWIPVPAALARAASPILHPVMLKLASGAVSGLGASLVVDGGRVAAAAGAIVVDKSDLGFSLAALLSGLAWVACLRARTSLGRALAWAALWGALGIPLQLLGIGVAIALVAAGEPQLGRAFLSDGLWVAVATIGCAYVFSRRPAASATFG